KPWQVNKSFEIGKPITVEFGSSKPNYDSAVTADTKSVFSGEITSIDSHFTERTQAPIVIRCYDHSQRLHRGRFNRSFLNMTDSDMVKKVAGEVGIELGTIDESGEPHDYLFQQNQTNMDFIRQRAELIGFELFIKDNKLNFRKPVPGETLELVWLRDVHSFRARVTSPEQVSEVEVRGWDYITKKPIVAKAQSEKVLTETNNGVGSETSSKFEGMPAPRMIVVDKPTFSEREAEAIAQSVCDELGGQYVTADAKAEGNPDIRPGQMVALSEMDSHDGTYYVTESRHIYAERIYMTEFSVRGLRSGDLLSTLSPRPHLLPGQTFLVGIVTDNVDPESIGRVKVMFPTLTEEHTSHWARVVNIGGGPNRGFDCLPEIDDEVLVCFEHGDIRRPYILGGVWNGPDKPPNPVDKDVQGGKVRLRTFQTRTGHKLQFVEEDLDTKAGVYIETTGGHKVRLNDSEKFVEIETSGGHKLRMSDGDANITLSSTGNIDIKANGTITLQGALIKLN
ncbi:MAG: VgrG-related protein, partial [Cyanobacteria bacterium J06598_3]